VILALQKYLEEHGPLTLKELAGAFGSAPDAVEPMLERLVAKGRVRRQKLRPGPPLCRGCARCRRHTDYEIVVYCAVERDRHEPSSEQAWQ
jgi:DNA-binding IclR family transcriptional regulator